MRLTADLIQRAPYYVNPIHQIEINLRTHAIQIIENLGAIPNECQVIDLSYNQIKILENFPRLKNLVALYLGNNQISLIQIENEKYSLLNTILPSLQTLHLQHNKIATFQSLGHLRSFTKLHCLTVSQNPIASHPLYRSFLISILPSLQMLDYQKVTDKDRKLASAQLKEYLAMDQEVHKLTPESFQKFIDNITSKVDDKASHDEKDEEMSVSKTTLTQGEFEQQKRELIQAITAATSIEEIEKFKKQLQELQLKKASLVGS